MLAVDAGSDEDHLAVSSLLTVNDGITAVSHVKLKPGIPSGKLTFRTKNVAEMTTD